MSPELGSRRRVIVAEGAESEPRPKSSRSSWPTGSTSSSPRSSLRDFGWLPGFDHTFTVRSSLARAEDLEIGAGTGTHLPYEPDGDYVALEASGDSPTKFPHGHGLSVVVGDCEERLPWEDGSFDRVLAIHLLEHLYNLPAALDEVARVLRPGWRVLGGHPLRRREALLAGPPVHDKADL